MDWTRVATAGDLERWYGVLAAAYAHDFVALPADPIGEYEPLLADDLDGNRRKEMWLATAPAGPAVAAVLEMPVHDNLDEAEVELSVAPALRRSGWGSAALAAVSGRCRDLGRTRQTVEAPGPLGGGASAAVGFAVASGFVPKQVEVRRLLDVETLDDGELAALEQSAWTHAEGYRLVSWADGADEALLPGLAALAARMSTDVPLGDIVREPEVWDTDRWRASERAMAARGRLRLGTAALRGEEVVAYTEYGVNRSMPTVGYQWDTIVRADHRGHRLGLLVKIANLRRLREASPRTRWVNTWNAASNAHMISINEAIGWRPVEAWTTCQRTL